MARAYAGVWSATPTPMTEDLQIDTDSVKRMVDHHVGLGVKGLFIGGTCGEGPLMTRASLRQLTRATVAASAGRLHVAVQVTDNSAARVLSNIAEAKEDEAGIAVVADPWFASPRTSSDYLLEHYLEIADGSALPVGLYPRDASLNVEAYRKLFAHENISLIKDSSLDLRVMATALEARDARPELTVLTGYEFDVVSYLKAGYDGALAGGAILIGKLLGKVIASFGAGDEASALRFQEQAIHVLNTAYGGPSISSWLTGLKYTLVKMGVFATKEGFLRYPVSDETERAIDSMVVELADDLGI